MKTKSLNSWQKFGKTLATLRRAIRMSQTALAKEANVSRATVSRIERATIHAKIETIDALADAIDGHMHEVPGLKRLGELLLMDARMLIAKEDR